MGSLRKQGGVWREVTKRLRKVGGQWRPVKQKYVKVGGVWRLADQFLVPTPVLQSINDFVGTYKVGVLDNGHYGAEYTGGQGPLGQTIHIGIKFEGIPEGSAVTFKMNYESEDPTNTVLYCRNMYGSSLFYWTREAPGEYASWDYFQGTVVELSFGVSGAAYKSAKFWIDEFYINGVRQF